MKERIGLKQFKNVLDNGGQQTKNKLAQKEAFKRENKNQPWEMSSKKAVDRFRDVVGVSSDLIQRVEEKCDPRFNSLCAEFNDELLKKSFKFVDDIRAKELVQLKEELKVETDPKRIEQMKYLIQRYNNQTGSRSCLNHTRRPRTRRERQTRSWSRLERSQNTGTRWRTRVWSLSISLKGSRKEVA